MSDRRLNWVVIVGVGLVVAFLAYQPAGAGASGFVAGQATGQAFGAGLIAAGLTYLVLRFIRRR